MKIKRPAVSAEYLNVDLEILSPSNLKPLIKALSKHLFVLHTGRKGGLNFSSFEVSSIEGSPDLAIQEMAYTIANLPIVERKVWDAAKDRVFDIGIKQTSGRQKFILELQQETMSMIANLGARVVFTLYPLPN